MEKIGEFTLSRKRFLHAGVLNKANWSSSFNSERNEKKKNSVRARMIYKESSINQFLITLAYIASYLEFSIYDHVLLQTANQYIQDAKYDLSGLKSAYRK